MIIAASRISTASGAAGVGSHVFEGPKNESIEVIRGCREDLDDMVRDARDHGAKYAIRHFKISPEQATTREQALAIVDALGREFGFDPERAVIVEHRKPRQGGKGFDAHWHPLVGEVDPVQGRVLDAHWMRARHEKVSRVAELELGHDQVRGKWNKAVERALRADDRHDLADRVKALTEGDRPREAFTAQRHQAAERRGLSMPEAKAAVAEAWQRADGGRGFAAALAENGLTVRQGERNGTWIVEGKDTDGDPVLVGAVHRLTGAKKNEAAAKLADLAAVPEATATSAHRADTVPAPQATVSPEMSAAPPVSVDNGAVTSAPELAASVAVETSTPAAVRPAEATPSPTPAASKSGGGASAAAPVSTGRAPLGGGHASSSGGSAAAIDTSGGSDFVAPLDPRKPGDFQRWMQQMAAYFERQAARTKQIEEAAVRAAQGGQHEQHDTRWIQEFIEQWRSQLGGGRQFGYGTEERRDFDRGQRAVRELVGSLDRICTTEATMDLEREPSRGAHLRDGGRREDSVGTEDRRLTRDDAEHVRGASRGAADRRVDAAPRPSEAAGGQGENGTRPDHGAPGADRREPDPHRAAAGRRRVRARRAVRGLAAAVDARRDRLAALTAAFAPPEERLRAALAESEARVSKVLESEPWKDPTTRDAVRISGELYEQRMETSNAKDREAEKARAAADRARAKVGMVDRLAARLGVRTDAMRATEEADTQAAQAEAARDGDRELRADLAGCDRRAAAIVRGREGERDQWRQRPEVAAALRQRRGDQLVKQAIQGGNKEIQRLAAHDLGAAREQLLRQEEEARRRMEEQLRRQREQEMRERMRGYSGTASRPGSGLRR